MDKTKKTDSIFLCFPYSRYASCKDSIILVNLSFPNFCKNRFTSLKVARVIDKINKIFLNMKNDPEGLKIMLDFKNTTNYSEYDEEALNHSMLNLLVELNETVAKNQDNRDKLVGDKIIVWDGSSLSDINNNERLVVSSPFTEREYFIVIETNLNNEFNTFVSTYIQNLIIVDPETGEQFRVSSSHVKLFN